MKIPSLLACTFAIAISCHAAPVGKAVIYQQGGVELEGYHAHDDSRTGKRPAVLVIHQWTGLSDYEKRRSHMLAEMGYNVLAADIYGKGIRPQPPAAGKEAGTYKNDRTLFRARIQAALDTLKADPLTDASRVAVIGYCFGGTGALEAARAGMKVNGVVSFHGGLDAQPGLTATPGSAMPKILVLHGAADPYVPATQVAAFHKEMDDAKADWQMVFYSGAVHSFTHKEAGDDPSKGAAYQEAADLRSWEAMRAFFAEVFR